MLGGFGQGFAQGMQSAAQWKEANARKQALKKQQEEQMIERAEAAINAGIESMVNSIVKSPQRSKDLEKLTSAHQEQINMGISALERFAPQQAAMARQRVQAALMTAKPMNEAYTDKATAESKAADVTRTAQLDAIYGPQGATGQPQLAAAPSPVPTPTPVASEMPPVTAPGPEGMVTPPAPTPTPAPAPVAAPPIAAPTSPAGLSGLPDRATMEKKLRLKELGIDVEDDKELTNTQKTKIGDMRTAQSALMAGIDDFEATMFGGVDPKTGQKIKRQWDGVKIMTPGTEAYELTQNIRTNLVLQAKEWATLGALTTPDIDLMNKLVVDPAAWSSLWMQEDTARQSLDALRRLVAQKTQAAEANLLKIGSEPTGYTPDTMEVKGSAPAKQPAGTVDAATEVPQIASDADYDKLPSGSVFIDPEGKRRRKP